MNEVYSKLAQKIVYSSMWQEDGDTCKIWVTILALRDHETGVLDKNMTGIARLCNLPLEKVEEAFEKFQSPDPNSSTETDDGRRIRKVDGGWQVVNHDKYLEYGWSEEKKRFERERKAQYRAKLDENKANKENKEKPPDVVDDKTNGSWHPTPLQLRLGKLFKRRETTRWDAREEKALKSLGTPLEDDLRLLEAYYTATIPKDQDYRRHDLVTLLNNFNGEVDRARKFKPPQPF